jgi:hypothetical protein
LGILYIFLEVYMKKVSITTVILVMFLLVFSTTLYSQSHAIVSGDQILSFTDPAVTTWYEPDIDGSCIMTWDEGVVGIAGGFCDLTAYTPFPGGGKYEVSLISVISSAPDTIQGIWQVDKNGTPVIVTMGTAEDLDTGVITITIEGFVMEVSVDFMYHGMLDPEEISGQAFVDGNELCGAIVRVRGGGVVLDTQNTDGLGKYEFLIDPDTVRRIVVVFNNYDQDIVVSGYVYVSGAPLAGATVQIKNQAGLLDEVLTDENGYYESNNIMDAVGAGLNKIRTIILK